MTRLEFENYTLDQKIHEVQIELASLAEQTADAQKKLDELLAKKRDLPNKKFLRTAGAAAR